MTKHGTKLNTMMNYLFVISQKHGLFFYEIVKKNE